MARSKMAMKHARRDELKFSTDFTTVEEDDCCSNYDAVKLVAYLDSADKAALCLLLAPDKRFAKLVDHLTKEYSDGKQ